MMSKTNSNRAIIDSHENKRIRKSADSCWPLRAACGRTFAEIRKEQL